MKTALVILSGGLDSTVLVYHLLNQGHNVVAMSVNYGQRHMKEIQFAAITCQKLGIRHEIADLSRITHLIGGSSQTSNDVAVPHGHYAAENMKLTVVPNRNMIMLSVALGFAIKEKMDFIAYGAHGGDHAIYPDCRPEFADHIDALGKLADWHPVEFLRPFINMSKADIVKLGASLNVPWEDTWSCYEGGDTHCGKCGTCVERKEAFELAGVVDPTVYQA